MQVEERASRAIYVRLRHRARMFRGLGMGFVVLIALSLAFGTIPYFLAGDMAVTETRAALQTRRDHAQHQTKGVEKQDGVAGETATAHRDSDTSGAPAPASGGAGAQPALSPAQPVTAPTTQPKAQQPADPASGLRPLHPAGDETFSVAVIRITAVVLLIALVYVFGSLYRYSMRLASYYDEKADSLRLLEAGELQLEERLAQITVPDEGRSGLPIRRRERV